MSVQTQNTNLNPYSNTPIKNLEYIQNKALVIAPFEITKSGKLDPDLLLDTPGIININIYKKMVSGEDKEPTANQFKTIKYISEIDSSNRISSFVIPVIFKYDKETNTRIIEKDLTQVSNNLDYIDFTIDVSNTDLSSETGSNGFFCVCQVQKIQKSVATTAFTEVANDEFLFMIPSVECREIPELVEFDLLDSDNKVINIKRFGEPGSGSILDFGASDFFEDGSNIATYLFDGYVRDENLSYNATDTDITYGPGKSGQAAVFNGVSSFINTGYKTPTIQGKLTVSYWVYLDTPTTSPGIIYGTSEYTNIYCAISAGQIEVASLQSTVYYYPTTKIVQGWNHIVVHHTTTPILYVNNQVVAPNRTNNSIGVNLSRDLWIGRIINYYGSVTIDQFRIFDRALTNIEIEALYYYIPNPITILDDTKQGYRIHPVINISDHVNVEESFTPKFYLGSKYQRNLMEVLAPAVKTKRTIYNLKDMYLVDDICLATLQKINQQLELDSMIKFTERLYNAEITEKINAEYILEFITSSVANSNNYTCKQIIVDSLIEDYLFTQEEIDNLNINLNTFKNRARLTIPSVTITGDQFKFNLPTSFVDSNRSGSLKTNLVIFGTDKGFDKYSLISGTIPIYSDITKLETPRVLNDLISTVPTLAGLKNGNIESYLTINLPRIFARTTSTGVTDISSNVQKAPGLLSDVDANGIRGIYSTANAASYSAANNFNFGTGDFTIESDLKSTISQDYTFFVIGEQGSACNLAIIFKSDNSLLFRAGTNIWGWDFSSDRSTPAGSILPGVYYHVVFQRTNGVLDIYIDGVKIHTSAWAYNIGATSNIWFGSYFGGGGHTNYRFNNFEVYKRAKYTGNFNSKTRYGSSDKFKSILTDYKQRLPFTYIPLSTNMDDVGSKPVFENLTDITGFNRSDIVIDIPNVL